MKLFLWELNYVNNKMHTYFMAVMLDDSYIFRFGRLTEHSLHSGISQFLFPISAHSWGSPTKFLPVYTYLPSTLLLYLQNHFQPISFKCWFSFLRNQFFKTPIIIWSCACGPKYIHKEPQMNRSRPISSNSG